MLRVLPAILIVACATGRPPGVVHAQILAGASAEGAAGILEVREADGATEGRALVLEPGASKMRFLAALGPDEIRAVLDAAAARKPGLASPTLAALGIEPGKIAPADALPIDLEVPGSPPLRLRIEEQRPFFGPGADVVLASDGLGQIEIEVTRFPVIGAGGIDGLWRLPGGERVLATAWSDATDEDTLWRVRTVRVIDLRKTAASLHAMHGLADYYREDWPASEGEYLRATKLEPGNASALYNLACVYALWGKPEPAMQILARALAADPRRLTMYARTDKDFESLREREDFRTLVDWKE